LRAKLGGALPADAAAARALFRELAAVAKLENVSKGTMQVSRLSAWLGTYGVSSSDAAALVVPGQHLTLNPVPSENEAPMVASLDPELLTMESKAHPKRLKVRGSDGKEYWWLAKGGEDLRQVRLCLAFPRPLASGLPSRFACPPVPACLPSRACLSCLLWHKGCVRGLRTSACPPLSLHAL
jgi:hypothetical protein